MSTKAQFLYWDVVVLRRGGQWDRHVIKAPAAASEVEVARIAQESIEDAWKVLVETRHWHEADTASLVASYSGNGPTVVVARCHCGARIRLLMDQDAFGPPDEEDDDDVVLKPT